MPSHKYKHTYTHNIPSEKDFDDMYLAMADGICYPVYSLKWSCMRGQTKIFEIGFTMEMQYYYSGGFELLKIKDINFEKFMESKITIEKGFRDIIGSDSDINDFYDVLKIEYKSPNKNNLYELFQDKAVKGRIICHTFIELFYIVMEMMLNYK